MRDGKKTLATKIVYQALEQFAQKISTQDILGSFEQAVANAQPLLEVKSRRIGGSTYQVPVDTSDRRRLSLAMRWIIQHAQNKPGQPMIAALSQELADCYNNQGTTIKKKEDVHRMAEANKAFAHYRW